MLVTSMSRTVGVVRTAASPPNDWARLIDDLVRRLGSIKKLVDVTGFDRNTIRRWRTGESANVTAETIRILADGTGIDYDEASRAALGAQQQMRADADAVVRRIEESDASDATKRDLIDLVRDKRRESEASILRDVDVFLRTRTT
jgi:transcriptional regulator with XRE-family HTH domain